MEKSLSQLRAPSNNMSSERRKTSLYVIALVLAVLLRAECAHSVLFQSGNGNGTDGGARCNGCTSECLMMMDLEMEHYYFSFEYHSDDGHAGRRLAPTGHPAVQAVKVKGQAAVTCGPGQSYGSCLGPKNGHSNPSESIYFGIY